MNSGRQRGRLWVMRNELDVLYATTLERNELVLNSYLRTVKVTYIRDRNSANNCPGCEIPEAKGVVADFP